MKKIFFLLLIILPLSSLCQVKLIHFNSGFNEANNVLWFNKLSDCEKESLSIEKDNNQVKYQIAVVPTIVVFDDGEEVKRFQADLSFKLVATKKEVQEYIDELIMSKF
jgi:hypothetical protein